MTHLEPPAQAPRKGPPEGGHYVRTRYVVSGFSRTAERLSHFLTLPGTSAEPRKRAEFVIPPPEVVHHRQRFLAQLPKHQLLDELHALEFEDFRVRLGAAIQVHADFPRTSQHSWTLDGRFIAGAARTRGGK